MSVSTMGLATRVLGRSGIRFPLLGFGAAPLGGVYKQWGDANKAVARAVELGAGYFDTSPYYGNSEEVLGKALVGHPRDRFLISTKVGRLAEDKFDFSPEWIERSVARSLRRLGVSHVDVLLLHDVEYAANWKEVAEQALPAAHRLKEKGLVRTIGFSCYPLEVAQKFINGPNIDLVDVVLLYGHNNLIDKTVFPVYEELQKKDISMIDASPLALGLLTDYDPPEWHAAPADCKKMCAELSAELRAQGHSLQQLAFKYAFRHTPGTSLLVGMSSAKEVEDNVELVKQVTEGKDSDEVIALENMLAKRLSKFAGISLS